MKKQYILITPVHNEEKYIGQVIECVVAQTILPKKWIIVNDASEDKTGEIVESFQRKHDFIEHLKLERITIKSYYSRRTEVFLLGYDKVKHLEHDFVAALDGDLTFSPDYYENIFCEFDANQRLGIASGIYVDKIDGGYKKVIRTNISTSGGIQVFRRECYKQIGGYIPLKYGADDSLAEYKARMKGWQTWSFPAYVAIHHRPMGTKDKTSIVKVRYRQGVSDYYLGSSIVFVLAKSLRRCIVEPPFIIGGLARICGFLSGYFKNYRREIPGDVVKYIRKEQICRLFGIRCKSNA